MVARAKEDAHAVLAKAAAQAEQSRQEILQEARGEAQRRQQMILASVRTEAARLHRERVHALLITIKDAIGERLLRREGLDYQTVLLALATTPLNRISGDKFVIKLSPQDYDTFSQNLQAELSHSQAGRLGTNVSLVKDQAITGGGLIVEEVSGRQFWDNRFVSRLERFWPALRSTIAIGAGLTENLLFDEVRND